jgi:hypothetical protein
MENRRPPIIDMTPDGRFAAPPASFQPAWPIKLGAIAVIVAVTTGFLALAALFLWIALWLIPIALIAGGVAYVALRFQMWRLGRAPRNLRPF